MGQSRPKCGLLDCSKSPHNGQTAPHTVYHPLDGRAHVMTYGEKRRAVTFNLDSPEERAMYELSLKFPFSAFVKKSLAAELKRQGQSVKSTLRVRMGE